MKPKFNFVPERQLRAKEKDTTFRVNIYKSGAIIFNRETVSVYDLDGKFYKKFADIEKKAIAWTFVDGKTSIEGLKDTKQLKKMKAGHIVMSVSKLLKEMGMPKKYECKGLEVKTYVSSLADGKFYYVTLPDKELSTEKAG